MRILARLLLALALAFAGGAELPAAPPRACCAGDCGCLPSTPAPVALAPAGAPQAMVQQAEAAQRRRSHPRFGRIVFADTDACLAGLGASPRAPPGRTRLALLRVLRI